MLGGTTHLMLGETEHLGHLCEGASGLERGEATYDRAMLASIFLKQQRHNIVFAVVREIDVDVRQLVQRNALFVEEAPKVEAEADRADAGDAQTEANERIGGAASRDPLDAALAALLGVIVLKERERADALEDVVAVALLRSGVMNGGARHHALTFGDCPVEPARKELGVDEGPGAPGTF